MGESACKDSVSAIAPWGEATIAAEVIDWTNSESFYT